MSRLITEKFTEREVYAMWSAICQQRCRVPWTSQLRGKLYDMLGEEKMYKLADMHDKHLEEPA